MRQNKRVPSDRKISIISTIALAWMALNASTTNADSSDPAAIIVGTYSWVDGPNTVLVLNVSPLATAASKFSSSVQYVFHTTSGTSFGSVNTKMDIVCTFDPAQRVNCWLGSIDFATGDASNSAGIMGVNKKFRVFTGLRDQPLFFNSTGYTSSISTIKAVKGVLSYDNAGCPFIDPGTSATLLEKLMTNPNSNPPGGPPQDNDAGSNVLSIVLSIDKSVFDSGGPYLSYWASTNDASH